MRREVGLVSVVLAAGCSDYCDLWDVEKTINGIYEIYPEENAMYLKIKINNTEADYARFTVYDDEVNTPYVLNRQEEKNGVIFSETIEDVDPTLSFLEYSLTVENNSCPENVEYSDTLDLTNLIDGYGSFNVYGL